MQNKINLIIFSSSLHDNNSVIGSRADLFDGIPNSPNWNSPILPFCR